MLYYIDTYISGRALFMTRFLVQLGWGLCCMVCLGLVSITFDLFY